MRRHRTRTKNTTSLRINSATGRRSSSHDIDRPITVFTVEKIQ